MGFFKKSLSAESKRTALTIIAKGNKISGEMTVTGKLHIDGCVEGAITSIENLSIGKTGKVNGNIKAKNITVTGLLEGKVFCEHLHIYPGGRVVAKVECFELTMDAKSEFFGERKVISTNTDSKATPAVEVNKKGVHKNIIKKSVADKVVAGKATDKKLSDKNLPQHSEQQKELTTPDFIQNLPDKFTLSAMSVEKNEQDIVGNLSMDSLKLSTNVQPIAPRKNKKTVQSDQLLEKLDIPVMPHDLEVTASERNKYADHQTADKLFVGEAMVNEIDKSAEAHHRRKLSDKNTTKLELKF